MHADGGEVQEPLGNASFKRTDVTSPGKEIFAHQILQHGAFTCTLTSHHDQLNTMIEKTGMRYCKNTVLNFYMLMKDSLACTHASFFRCRMKKKKLVTMLRESLVRWKFWLLYLRGLKK